MVNNAGIGVTGPMETVPLGDLRRQYDVNVFGQVEVIPAFLPLLRTGAGRMVNIGEALRLEVRPWGIHVVLVEPASIHTEAVGKVEADSERVLERLRADGHTRYAAAYRATTRRALSREKAGSSPDVVARTVLRALSAPRPRTRYLVGKDAHLLAFLAGWAPDRLFDLVRLRLFGLPAAFGPPRGGRPPGARRRARSPPARLPDGRGLLGYGCRVRGEDGDERGGRRQLCS